MDLSGILNALALTIIVTIIIGYFVAKYTWSKNRKDIKILRDEVEHLRKVENLRTQEDPNVLKSLIEHFEQLKVEKEKEDSKEGK